MGGDPTPAYVPFVDMEMYGVSAPGWYMFDDNHRAVDGPYPSRAAAVRGSVTDTAAKAKKKKKRKSIKKKKRKS